MWISGDTYENRRNKNQERISKFYAHIAKKIDQENKFLTKQVKSAFSRKSKNFMPLPIQDIIMSYCPILD